MYTYSSFIYPPTTLLLHPTIHSPDTLILYAGGGGGLKG